MVFLAPLLSQSVQIEAERCVSTIYRLRCNKLTCIFTKYGSKALLESFTHLHVISIFIVDKVVIIVIFAVAVDIITVENNIVFFIGNGGKALKPKY